MSRPNSNKNEILRQRYEAGDSLIECAKAVGYSLTTAKQRLQEMGLYDPPLKESYLKDVWDEWERTCDMLRRSK